MNRSFFVLVLATIALPACAQTASKSAAASHTATTAHPVAHPGTAGFKLPPGVPPVRGPVVTGFALRYQEIKTGAGPEGESGKIWHIKYTGWRAADGVKFDSWDEHKQPVIGSDGKPEMGPDGKPVLGAAEPAALPQGVGHLIPGFDYGLAGMRIGGKRRIFIPWQMAYGTHAIPERPDHPGIPAKSDLIFDVELVGVTDMPQAPPGIPGGMPMPHSMPHPSTNNPGAAAPTQPSTPPPASSTPAQPSTQTPPK
jgi:peptidylprolyl isomerase